MLAAAEVTIVTNTTVRTALLAAFGRRCAMLESKSLRLCCPMARCLFCAAPRNSDRTLLSFYLQTIPQDIFIGQTNRKDDLVRQIGFIIILLDATEIISYNLCFCFQGRKVTDVIFAQTGYRSDEYLLQP